MTTPDLMPILSSGDHSSPKEGACIMEYASLLAGEEWSDSPACTHPVLASMARVVNDRIGDSARQSLLPLLPRLMGTAETGTAAERHRLSVSLAVWCAEQVAHLTGRTEPAAREAIRVTRAWLDGEATQEECRDAAYAAAYAATHAAHIARAARAFRAAHAAAATAYARAAHAAATAAYAAARAARAAYDADAAATAANAAAANDDAAELLTGLIDEYDRLTGRTQPAPLTPEDMRTLTEATA